uniref:Transmembrane domain-containing protein n=1 Tax=Spironucleus salmonicida TaxID=348837 RepID=V6LWS6_9EUKA|eukprot:EST45254.1 Transmembrane domain-containing protein [Spironucleus salmonicida]
MTVAMDQVTAFQLDMPENAVFKLVQAHYTLTYVGSAFMGYKSFSAIAHPAGIAVLAILLQADHTTATGVTVVIWLWLRSNIAYKLTFRTEITPKLYIAVRTGLSRQLNELTENAAEMLGFEAWEVMILIVVVTKTADVKLFTRNALDFASSHVVLAAGQRVQVLDRIQLFRRRQFVHRVICGISEYFNVFVVSQIKFVSRNWQMIENYVHIHQLLLFAIVVENLIFILLNINTISFIVNISGVWLQLKNPLKNYVIFIIVHYSLKTRI